VRTQGEDDLIIPEQAEQEEVAVRSEQRTLEDQASPDQEPGLAEEEAARLIDGSLVRLGFVNFDEGAVDNNTASAMVAAEHRMNFRRDLYVGIRDDEQGIEFLGRVVEGPYHAPHEVSAGSAITRTTVLHPERTRFRPTYYVEGAIEILGQLADGERLLPTSTRPRPYSEIYAFPAERLQDYLGISGDCLLGNLMGYEGLHVKADTESKSFLPRNVGVFGTIGSGKSNTIQVIIEEALNAGWAVVVIDVEGEYVRMDEPTTDREMIGILESQFGKTPVGVEDLRVYVPQSGHSEAECSIRFKVPVSGIDPYVLSDLMYDLTEAQARLLEILTERLRRQSATADRLGVLSPESGGEGQAQRPYTLQDLIDVLRAHEAGEGDSSLVPPSTHSSTPPTLRSKLIRLGMSQMLDWNGTRDTDELPVDDLLVGGRLSVLDVSETDDRSRNIAIAYALQALFDRVISTPVGEEVADGIPRPKVLVVIEEVHTFVSRSSAAKMRSVIDSLQIISRRGRKRWMALALVSQQPGHVPDELFELANTRFIHQLKSVANLAPVKQTTGGVHEALWTSLPSLALGQCLLTGPVFRNPVFVQIRPSYSKRTLVD